MKLGLGAALVLGAAGGAVRLFEPGLVDGRTTLAARRVLEGVARAVLDGSLPTAAAERGAALSAHLQRLDDAILRFPPATQAELSRLLALLAAPPGRRVFAGLAPPWHEAGVAQIQAALQGMRTSRLALRQQAYHALRDLTNAAYYADPSSWGPLGYPGPTDL